MNCPECGVDSSVLETRGDRRRRECRNGHKFSTLEIVIDGSRKLAARNTKKFRLSKEKTEQIAKDNRDAMAVALEHGVHLDTVYRIRKNTP